jgi:hypothetical protein
MASAIILAAREAVGSAGMDRAAFAAYIGDDVSPEDLEFWEIGGSMPADVMLLCAAVLREAAVSGLPVAAEVRSAVEQMPGLPRLPPGDPVRELLNRRPE